MKKIVLLLSLVVASVFTHAQTWPQYQLWYSSFDSTGFGQFPPHIAEVPAQKDPNAGWWIDTTGALVSSGYLQSTGLTPSGNNNCTMADDSTANGIYNLQVTKISTYGYKNVSIIWGANLSPHYQDSGSVNHFSISTDSGATWDTIHFIENPNDHYWHLENNSVPISLPASANNIKNLWFRITANTHHNVSGKYRIDDIYVFANDTAYNRNDTTKKHTGVSTVDEQKAVVTVSNNQLNMYSNSVINYAVIYDLTGNRVKDVYISNMHGSINVSDLAHGMYIVRLYTANGIITRKQVL